MSLITALALAAAQPAPAADFRARLPEDEVIYFLLPDRFDNGDVKNDRGGDLKGLVRRLDYLQGMGVTAIWYAPIFKNKPVQGGK